MHLVKKIVPFLGMLAIASGVNIGAMNDNNTPTIVLAQSKNKLQTLVHKDKPNSPLTTDQINTIVRTSQQCYQVKISENDKPIVSFWWYKYDPHWCREDCKLANADNFVWKDIGDAPSEFKRNYVGEQSPIYTISNINQTSTIGQLITELNNRSFYFINWLTIENSYFCIDSNTIKTETITNKPTNKIVETKNNVENKNFDQKIKPYPTEQKFETEDLSKKTETNTPENKVTEPSTNIPTKNNGENENFNQKTESTGNTDNQKQIKPTGQKFWTPAFVLRVIGGFTGSFIGQSFYEQAKESGFCKRHPWATLFGNFLPFALPCACAVDKMGDKRNNIDRQIEYQQGHIALSCVAGSILGHLYGKPLTTWASKRISNLISSTKKQIDKLRRPTYQPWA